jgi:hypothetical protein
MITLHETDVPHVRTERTKPGFKLWNPLRLFCDHALAARAWCLVAMVAVGFVAVQPFLIIRAYRTPERVVILDESGTFHVSPLLAFENATKLHEQETLLACVALYSRGPSGADYPELLDKLFLTEAAKQAKSTWSLSAEEFSAKALHQKPEVLKLTVLETRESQVLVQAEGRLIRTGNVGGQTFTEEETFTARFTFARNPNLAGSGRHPLAVWHYDVSL